MSTTTIPTALADRIVRRLAEDTDITARDMRTELMECMQDATSPGLAIVPPPVDRHCACGYAWSTRPDGCDCIAPVPIEPAANAPEVEREPGPLSFAIFVDGEYVEARDGYAVPRKGDVILVGRSRCLVMLVEWHSMEVIHVHTLLMPDVGGGPF